MASGLSLMLKGIGALISITVIILLVFVNGIIGQPLMTFVFAGTYTRTYGFDMIPVIQWVILFMALAGFIISAVSIWIEVFAEVAYASEY